MAHQIPDSTMELIAHLFSFMDDDEKAAWSKDTARDMIDDQCRYEIENGMTPPYYSVTDFYEIIAELIRQDEEDGN